MFQSHFYVNFLQTCGSHVVLCDLPFFRIKRSIHKSLAYWLIRSLSLSDALFHCLQRFLTTLDFDLFLRSLLLSSLAWVKLPAGVDASKEFCYVLTMRSITGLFDETLICLWVLLLFFWLFIYRKTVLLRKEESLLVCENEPYQHF